MELTITDPLITRDYFRKANPNFGDFSFPEELVMLTQYITNLHVIHVFHQHSTGERYSFSTVVLNRLAESLELDREELDRLHDLGTWIHYDRDIMAMSESERLAHYAFEPSDDDIEFLRANGFDLETIINEVTSQNEQRANEVAFLNEIFENTDSGLDNQ